MSHKCKHCGQVPPQYDDEWILILLDAVRIAAHELSHGHEPLSELVVRVDPNADEDAIYWSPSTGGIALINCETEPMKY